MAKRRKGRPIDGILILNKPTACSSNHALQQVKRAYFAQKAGHTGNLDPMATGVLPICLGEATKFSQYLLDADKAYRATIRFGELTDTGDADGKIIAVSDASAITQAQLEQAMSGFRGDIEQIPPMFSALKFNGQPLYKLAREGKEVERKARSVTIYALELLAFRGGENPEAEVYVKCSKGTYIRTLAMDIAEVLGVGAHLIALHRVQSGQFHEAESMTMAQLQALKEGESFSALDNLLISAEIAVNHLPLVELDDTSGYYVRLGQAVFAPNLPTSGLVRLKQDNGLFIGVGEITDDGRVKPHRIIAS